MASVVLLRTVLLISFFGSAIASAKTEKLVLRMERDAGGFHEQTSLIYEPKIVKIVRNSNFNCYAEDSVALGLIEKALDGDDKIDRGLVEQVIKRRNMQSDSSRRTEALGSSVRYFVDRADMTDDRATVRLLQRIFEKHCSQTGENNRKMVRGAVASLDGSKAEPRLRIREYINSKEKRSVIVSPKQGQCKKLPESRDDLLVMSCRVLEYGRGVLKAK